MNVSVILRTKDRNLFLSRALASILRQSYRDIDVIVINDGGDSVLFRRTVDLALSDAPAAVRVIDRPASLGRTAALNEAMDASRGDMVCIHDDDDSWHPRCVEMLAARYATVKKTIPKLVGCICGLIRIHEEITATGELRTIREEIPGPENASRGLVKLARYLLQREDFYPIQCMFDRAAALKAGGFDPTFEIFEDRHLFIRLLAVGEFCVERQKLAHHHVRPDQARDSDAANVSHDQEKHDLYFSLLENSLVRGWIPNLPQGSPTGLTPLVKAIIEARAMPPPRRRLRAFLREAITVRGIGGQRRRGG